MNGEQFDNIVHVQMKRSTDMLIVKAKEYATEDRLHNFRVAAKLSGCDEKKALAGMMVKHTVSVYDMCNSEETFSDEKWNEKITDHINYLLILKAVVEDENDKRTQGLKCDGGEK